MHREMQRTNSKCRSNSRVAHCSRIDDAQILNVQLFPLAISNTHDYEEVGINLLDIDFIDIYEIP